ncbi:MAG: FAD-dependent oxidoreductase [Dehalococcoidia bacterium]
MATKPQKWDLETDVLVLGSGGAGLTAAIIARDEGSDVVLLEKTSKIGGATAVSGGFPWIPNNHLEPKEGISDSREDALTYMRFIADGQVDDELIVAFVDNAPVMMKYIEEKVGLKTVISEMPDYHDGKPGGKVKGRSLGPDSFDSNELGEWKNRLRQAPVVMFPTSWEEYEKSNAKADPSQLDYVKLANNMMAGIVGMGMSTAAHLLKGCLDRGVEPVMKARAMEFIQDEDGRVIGVRAEKEGKDFYVRASQGVILATGGFEWNEELRKKFVPSPDFLPLSPPGNEGDGLKMAIAIGAELGNMHQIWGVPSCQVPGEEYDGKPLGRMTMGERTMPHAIMVNRQGRRFVDESFNYSDVAKVFCDVNPVTYEHVNVPAWLVFDQQFKDKYLFFVTPPGEPVQEWVIQADTAEELATKAGFDPEGFKATLERFNEFAQKGEDPDFGRGSTAYDRYQGDPNHKPNDALGTVEKPPFYAVPIMRGALGSKGGPATNVNGQVKHIMGGVIEGLYAAGNAMASTSGPGYAGAGNTIAAGMTWGYIAARHATKQPKK